MFLNIRLLAHPANWIIIFLVLYLCALCAHVVFTAATTGQSPIPFPGVK